MRSAPEQPHDRFGDAIERQNSRATSRGDRLSRHAPDDAGRLVLGDHGAPGRGDGFAALRAIRAHARQNHAERASTPHRRTRCEHRIDRRLAEMHRRTVIKRRHRAFRSAHDPQVPATRREIDRAGLDRFAIDGFTHGTAAAALQMFGQDRRESRRHMLRDQHRRTLQRRADRRDQCTQGLRSSGRATDQDHTWRHAGKPLSRNGGADARPETGLAAICPSSRPRSGARMRGRETVAGRTARDRAPR